MPADLPVFSRVSEEDLSDAPKGKWVEAITTPLNNQLDASKKLLNGGITFSQNIQSETREVDILVPDCWTALTLVNGFSNDTGTAGYIKHPDGSVEIRGVVSSGTPGPLLISTLPVGCRPQQKFYFPIYANTAIGVLSIDVDGKIKTETGDVTAVYIERRFMSSDATPVVNSSLPVTFVTRFTSAPLAVLVIGVTDITKTEVKPIGTMPIPDWSFGTTGGKPGIKINNVTGLPYNRKYRLKLLIIGG